MLSKSDTDFRRAIGIKRETFEELWIKVEEYSKRNDDFKRKIGSQYGLRGDLLYFLYFMRNNMTFSVLGDIMLISESQAHKLMKKMKYIVDKVQTCDDLGLDTSELKALELSEVIAIDATETPIERPEQNQAKHYSGKKKHIRSKHN